MLSHVALLQLAFGWGIHDEWNESSGESGRKGMRVKNDGMEDEHDSENGDHAENSGVGKRLVESRLGLELNDSKFGVWGDDRLGATNRPQAQS